MRTITKARFLEVVQPAHPAARLEIRDGEEIAVIPTYDANTDTEGQITIRVVDALPVPKGKVQVGDVRIDSKSGQAFKVVGKGKPPKGVRRGPKANFDE